MNGWKFTGPNGGTIFLPAAGDRWNGELEYAGSGALYWSSTLDESDPNLAYGLFFNSRSASRGLYARIGGHSVRPVR